MSMLQVSSVIHTDGCKTFFKSQYMYVWLSKVTYSYVEQIKFANYRTIVFI
jgi:hypothetical protein